MHGLMNRAVQCFIRDMHGANAWAHVTRQADLGFDDFEAMLTYEDTLIDQVLAAAGKVLEKPRQELLEDLGTYLVSHPNVEAVRRLMRLSGESYQDFLHSLNDLRDRARLAVPDFDFPSIRVEQLAPDRFRVQIDPSYPGVGFVIVGVLRAMADDYGTLAMPHVQARTDGGAEIMVELLDTAFAAGRAFSLSQPGARPT